MISLKGKILDLTKFIVVRLIVSVGKHRVVSFDSSRKYRVAKNRVAKIES